MEEISTPVGGKTNSFSYVSSRIFLLLPFQWFFPKPGIVSSQDSKIGELSVKTPELSLRSAHSCLLAWCVLKF